MYYLNSAFQFLASLLLQLSKKYWFFGHIKKDGRSRLSLSRNPVCTQKQTGSRTYMSEKTAKRNEDNRSLHFHVANFFKFMAANLSFTQFVT